MKVFFLKKKNHARQIIHSWEKWAFTCYLYYPQKLIYTLIMNTGDYRVKKVRIFWWSYNIKSYKASKINIGEYICSLGVAKDFLKKTQ